MFGLAEVDELVVICLLDCRQDVRLHNQHQVAFPLRQNCVRVLDLAPQDVEDGLLLGVALAGEQVPCHDVLDVGVVDETLLKIGSILVVNRHQHYFSLVLVGTDVQKGLAYPQGS